MFKLATGRVLSRPIPAPTMIAGYDARRGKGALVSIPLE
jgi:hypothetical protein